MRLASIILATVRPEAALEPKVEATCQLAVEKVSLVKAFGVLPSPSRAVANAAPMMRSSHSRATPAAAAATSCEVGSIAVLSLSKVSTICWASLSTGSTQRLVKSTSWRAIGEKRPCGVFICTAPVYWIGEACLPTWKPSMTVPRSIDMVCCSFRTRRSENSVVNSLGRFSDMAIPLNGNGVRTSAVVSSTCVQGTMQTFSRVLAGAVTSRTGRVLSRGDHYAGFNGRDHAAARPSETTHRGEMLPAAELDLLVLQLVLGFVE